MRRQIAAMVAALAGAAVAAPPAAGLDDERRTEDRAAANASLVEHGDWVVDTAWRRGCERHRWCKQRRLDPDRDIYRYSDCYWGGCALGHGGFGGYDGRGY